MSEYVYPPAAIVNEWRDEFYKLEDRGEHPSNLVNYIARRAVHWTMATLEIQPRQGGTPNDRAN